VLASAIATSKEAREVGDYDIGVEITKELAAEVLSDAEKFVEKIEEAINEINFQERL